VLGDRVTPDRRHAAALEQLHRIRLAKAGKGDPQAELGQKAEDPVARRGPQLDQVGAAPKPL
jgi:hypothetical protein